MPTIKRYSNRKLYNTESKKYITLDEIANFIRECEEIHVVDNDTGDDLTALTLTQIIFEQEKKREFLPKSVLTALIQAGGESLSSIRQRLASPLDLIRQVDEEIDQRLEGLIQRCEIAEEAGRKLREQLLEYSHLWGGTAWIHEEDIERIIKNQGIPNREEFQSLIDQIDALSTKIDSLKN